PPVNGKFVDTKGSVLGEHKGIVYYTVGQSKGLGATFGKPMYVVRIDADSNTVVLGQAGEEFSMGLFASDLNWIAFDKLHHPMQVRAKVRYSAREADAIITPLDGGTLRVDFQVPQRAITPGQSVVFYDGEVVLGGGVIDKQIQAE
ncbi:MAG: tRNA 2-thiouridine(34) synthase MnmA, partial [Thermoclostridium sp.]|nr:tRNA 2-thiouridine(34) synthase MnmA [Thermoclostridium sp.]